MQIIALTGTKGSGKDTVGSLIQAMVPESKTIAFADPIKKVIQGLFDLDKNDIDQYDKFKRGFMEYSLPGYFRHSVPSRHIVREVGMLMRSYDEEQFCRYVLTQMIHNPNVLWIVTDLRFDNELKMVKGLGGIVVRIQRPNYKPDGHITEQGFADDVIDYNIVNDKDMNALKQQVEAVMKDIV